MSRVPRGLVPVTSNAGYDFVELFSNFKSEILKEMKEGREGQSAEIAAEVARQLAQQLNGRSRGTLTSEGNGDDETRETPLALASQEQVESWGENAAGKQIGKLPSFMCQVRARACVFACTKCGSGTLDYIIINIYITQGYIYI